MHFFIISSLKSCDNLSLHQEVRNPRAAKAEVMAPLSPSMRSVSESNTLSKIWSRASFQKTDLAGEDGIEPPFTAPKAAVLPLDDTPLSAQCETSTSCCGLSATQSI